jgi:hypothetical protein
MQALIVGADRVRGVRDEILRAAPRLGIEQVEHWPGRKVAESRRQVSNRTALVVFMCDRANHMLMHNVRRQAEARGIPMVFCRHSGAQVRVQLEALMPVGAGDR